MNHDFFKTYTMLVILTLLSFHSIAQRVAVDEKDEFTGQLIYKVDVSSGKFWKNSDKISEGIMNNIFLSSKLIKKNSTALATSNLQFNLGSMLCANPSEGKLILILTDGAKIELRQYSDLDCKQILDVQYLIYDSNSDNMSILDALSSTSIAKFRVYFTEGYLDFKIRENKQELIREHYRLILDRLNE